MMSDETSAGGCLVTGLDWETWGNWLALVLGLLGLLLDDPAMRRWLRGLGLRRDAALLRVLRAEGRATAPAVLRGLPLRVRIGVLLPEGAVYQRLHQLTQAGRILAQGEPSVGVVYFLSSGGSDAD